MVRLSSVSLCALLAHTCCLVATLSERIERRYDLSHDYGRGFVARNSFVSIVANDDGDGLATTVRNLCAVGDDDEKYEDVCSDPRTRYLSENDVFALMESGGLYKVKARDVATGSEVTTSASPCEIKKSNYRERINLVLSSNGDLISLEYTPLVSPLMAKTPCETLLSEDPRDELNDLPRTFNSTASFSLGTPGMTVPVVLSSPMNLPKGSFQALPRDRVGSDVGVGETGAGAGASEPRDDAFGDGESGNQRQSFLMRYWYIILPLFIMSMLGAEEPPPEQGGEPQQQGTAAAPATATATATGVAAASAVGGGGGGRVRRGKRS